MDQSDRIHYLLNRYLSDKCTRHEMNELLDYLQKHPEDTVTADILRQEWLREERFLDSKGSFAWSQLQERMHGISAQPHRPRARALAFKVAASVLLLCVCLAALSVWIGDTDRLAVKDQPDVRPVNTTDNEHRLVVLADGSKVWINANSKLSCAPTFNEERREVVLHGEAYFDIHHDPAKPFVITTGVVKTTVLGTAFNIRAFPTEKAVTVTVKRGKVRVESGDKKQATITANQQVTLDMSSAKAEGTQKISVNPDSVSRWTKQDIILHEIAFGDAQELLEERYAIDIRFDNPELEKCRFTFTFFEHAGLDEVLKAICLVNGASYEKVGQQVTIYGKGCADDPVFHDKQHKPTKQ